MVNFEVTDRIRGALKKVIAMESYMDPEVKQKYEQMVFRQSRVIPLEDLKQLSEYLKKYPVEDLDEELNSCRYVHELVVGSKVVPGSKFSPSKGKPISNFELSKIRNRENERDDVSVLDKSLEKDIVEEDDRETLQSHKQIGSFVVVTMALLYFLGYYTSMSVTENDILWSVIGGLICAFVSLVVELWIFSMRSEEADIKLARYDENGISSPLR